MGELTVPEHRHHVVDVDGLAARGSVRLNVEDETCAMLAVQVEPDGELRAGAAAALLLTADELGHLAAAATDVRRELDGDADPFAGCFNVEHHVGDVDFVTAVGPDHATTGEAPRYVRLSIGEGPPIDLSPAAAAALAGALASGAAELLA